LSFGKKEFESHAELPNPQHFPFLVVGNRCDLAKDRKVSTTQATDWCKAHGGLRYIETSAKLGTNVEKAFHTMATEVLRSNSVQRPLKAPETLELTAMKKFDGDKKNCCLA